MEKEYLSIDERTHHGHNFKRITDRKGIKLEQLEQSLQLSQENILELQESKRIDDDMLEKLANALNVSVETMKEMKEEPNSITIQNNAYNQDNSPGSIQGLAGYNEGITINNESSDAPQYHFPLFGLTYEDLKAPMSEDYIDPSVKEKYKNVSEIEIVHIYSRMLKMEREKNARLEKRIDGMEALLKKLTSKEEDTDK